jgi:hypothetical protein
MIAARYKVPVLNLFPIWRYGPITDFDGRYVRDGWYPDRFSDRTFKTLAEAEQFVAESTTTTTPGAVPSEGRGQ